jgi:hypothetical protein
MIDGLKSKKQTKRQYDYDQYKNIEKQTFSERK